MLSNYVLDKFVAPEISRLTQNGARDITHLPETATSWVRTFVLASMLKFSFEEQRRQYIFNFLRRAEGAVAYYHEARGYLADYLASGPEAISRYMLAALHFESAIANLYESAMLLRNLLGEEKLFVKGDGSFLDRLNFVYNSAKHANKTIASGQMPNEGTIPVWITNDGLKSRTAYVTFAELTEAIEEVARFADLLSNPEAPPADPSPKAAAGG